MNSPQTNRNRCNRRYRPEGFVAALACGGEEAGVLAGLDFSVFAAWWGASPSKFLKAHRSVSRNARAGVGTVLERMQISSGMICPARPRPWPISLATSWSRARTYQWKCNRSSKCKSAFAANPNVDGPFCRVEKQGAVKTANFEAALCQSQAPFANRNVDSCRCSHGRSTCCLITCPMSVAPWKDASLNPCRCDPTVQR